MPARTTGNTPCPRSLMAAAVLAAAGSGGALAQPVLEEVIVTAQKREQTLRDVPSSVTAVTSDLLAKSATTNFNDLGKIASGIEIGGGSDGFGAQVRIRGIGTNKFSPGISPSVGIFVDDIPLVDIGSAYNNLSDIERLEILKGPQSTLFGKGVSSGAIKITTKRPDTQEFEAFVEANIGTGGLQEYRGGLNIPLGDVFAFRGSLYSTERDGQIENTEPGGGEGLETETWGGRFRLQWEGEALTAMLGYELHRSDAEGAVNIPLEYGDFFQTYEANVPGGPALLIRDPFKRKTQESSEMIRFSDTDIYSLHIDWDINDNWSLASVTAYQEFEVGNTRSRLLNDEEFPIKGSAAQSIGPYLVNPFVRLPVTSDSFTQEVRLNFESGDWVSVFGFFYADSETNSEVDLIRTSSVVPPIPPFVPVLTTANVAIESFLQGRTDEWAIFTHNTYTINDRTSVTFGLRYAEVDKDDLRYTKLGVGRYESLNGPVPFNPLFPPFPVSDWDAPRQKDTWDSITGGLKFTYDFSDDATVYAGFDRGFKAGGFDSVGHDSTDPTGQTFTLKPAFDEEVGTNLEVGIKGFFMDRRLGWNASAFYQTYDDFQVNVPDPETTLLRLQNAAEVIVQGVDMDFTYLASERLTIDGNLAYIDSRYDEFETAGCIRPQYAAVACSPSETSDALVQDLSDKRVSSVSPWTANINATWDDSFDNGWDWFLRGEYVFRDDRIYMYDLDPASRSPSYSVFNASFGVSAADGSWQAILWGKNLFDEEYMTNIESNSADGVAVYGLRGTVGDEPMYGLTLKYNYFR